LEAKLGRYYYYYFVVIGKQLQFGDGHSNWQE